MTGGGALMVLVQCAWIELEISGSGDGRKYAFLWWSDWPVKFWVFRLAQRCGRWRWEEDGGMEGWRRRRCGPVLAPRGCVMQQISDSFISGGSAAGEKCDCATSYSICILFHIVQCCAATSGHV